MVCVGYSLDSSRLIPFARTLHWLDYRLYFSRHMNYLTDLKWDNLDGLIPTVGAFHGRTRLAPKGRLSPATDANPKLAEINRSGIVNKNKLIAYAGYLSNPYQKTGLAYQIDKNGLAFWRWLTVKVPMH